MSPDSWRPDEPAARPGIAIGAAAKRLMQVRGYTSATALAEVMRLWSELVGEEAAAHAKPALIRGEALLVDVSEPAWATEMQFRSAAILERLRDHLGEAAPSSLTARVARPAPRQKPL
jgi:predicted nucleic acid-binding Zn ribbon protein